MPTELRCPGFKATPDPVDDPAELTYHTRWIRRPANEPARRYHCRSCEAHYAYLIDVAQSPPERYTNAGPLGPQHPADPHDYGN